MLVHATVSTQCSGSTTSCFCPSIVRLVKTFKITLKLSNGTDCVHHIKSSFTCACLNVIYVLECTVHHKRYIDETGWLIMVTLNEHYADIVKALLKQWRSILIWQVSVLMNVNFMHFSPIFAPPETENIQNCVSSTSLIHSSLWI